MRLNSRVSFSFLYRNERTATTLCAIFGCCAVVPFQFPLSERTNCNLQRAFVLVERLRALSVSSIGTNELQPPSSPSAITPCSIFQFPLSERTNCNHSFNKRGVILFSSFQFPLSERTNCNDNPNQLRRCLQNFQFPLSERTNCNPCQISCQGHTNPPFSFLYRNERTATARLTDA